MKKVLNISGIILFTLLIPFTCIAYKIMDVWEAMKVNTDLPDNIEVGKTHPIYPDEPAKDFNEWAQYIHKQLN